MLKFVILRPRDERGLIFTKVLFQGLPARICWFGYGERVKAELKFNKLIAKL